MPWYGRAIERVFGRLIERRVGLAVKVIDDGYWRDVGRQRTQDRPQYQMERQRAEYLRVWRDNPLCRRMVGLVTDYVLGSGLTVSSASKLAEGWCKRFWEHPQNHMASRLSDWCDELTRAGELFVVLSRNPIDGMSYVRLVPAEWIDEIETDPDDLERELRYHEKPVAMGAAGRWWPAAELDEHAKTNQVMLHMAINRPAGCVRGESDLGPVLAWLDHYARWLEDRVRVNRLKSAFVWQVTLNGATPQVIAQKRAMYGQPPAPGSVIICNESEKWEAVQPKIDGQEAAADGKAIRMMAAAGMGVPLHFLSEGESATKATAQQMGDPTFRHFRRRQREMCDLVKRLLTAAYTRAAQIGRARAGIELQLKVEAPEIVQEDNESLGRAVRMTVEGLRSMHAAGWVDDATAAAMAFKAAGEIVDDDRLVEILALASAQLAAEQAAAAAREASAATSAAPTSGATEGGGAA